MLNRRTLLLAIISASALSAADWDPAAAARYLDGRQQEWFAWKRAQTPEGTCVSCHTGMPYLLARPALRKTLREAQPTEWESKLLDRLRDNAGHERKVNIQGPEAIFGALFLSREDPHSRASQAAQFQLRDLQLKEGPMMGILQWYDAKLEPWESQNAFSWGAALSGLSGMVDVPHTVAWLREHRNELTLHSRLAMLWASPKMPGLLEENERKALISEVLRKQQPDGSWTIQSLGEFMPHPDAPAQPEGGHPYATAYTAFILRQAGAPEAKAAVGKAQAWLKASQDKATGSWFAPSMNKKYPDGSMESKFMADAATSFAVLALSE